MIDFFHNLIKIAFSTTMFFATPEHPFYANGHYVNAIELQVGDSVLTQSGEWDYITQVEEKDSTANVYNLEVTNSENTHNYFIGDKGYLVHNYCLGVDLCLMVKLDELVGEKAVAYHNAVKHLAGELTEQGTSKLNAFNKAVYDLGDDAERFIDDLIANKEAWNNAGILGDVDVVANWKKLFKPRNNASSQLRNNTVIHKFLKGKSSKLAQSELDELLKTQNLNYPIKEVIEDAQGRLIIVMERGATSSNKVVCIHPTASGQYKTSVFSRAYNPNANPKIPVQVSANKIAPDYSIGSGRQYLYPVEQGQENIVRIKMTGKRGTNQGDFYAANKEAGFVDEFGSAPPSKIIDGEEVDYVWHHLDDMYIDGNGDIWCTMQLVEVDAHTGIKGMAHSGSVKQHEVYTGTTYK